MNKFRSFVIRYSSQAKEVKIVTLCNKDGRAEYSLVGVKNYKVNNGNEFLNDINKLSGKGEIKLINFKIVAGSIKTTGYSFDIFEKQGKAIPNVLLAYMVDSHNKANNLGYVMFNTKNCVCFKVKEADMIERARYYNKYGAKLLHNAKFVEATEDKKAYISLFSANSIDTFEVATVDRNRITKYSISTKQADKSQYNAYQLQVLKEAKASGKNYKKVCDPRLSAEQMKILLDIDSLGFDCRYLASPKYDVKVLKFYRAEVRNGGDLKCYTRHSAKTGANILDYRFNPSQLAEICLGNIAGINYRKYMKPSLSATEMSEIRTRLEKKLWTTMEGFEEEDKDLSSRVELYKMNFSRK